MGFRLVTMEDYGLSMVPVSMTTNDLKGPQRRPFTVACSRARCTEVNETRAVAAIASSQVCRAQRCIKFIYMLG